MNGQSDRPEAEPQEESVAEHIEGAEETPEDSDVDAQLAALKTLEKKVSY